VATGRVEAHASDCRSLFYQQIDLCVLAELSGLLVTDYICHILALGLVYLLLQEQHGFASDSIPSHRSVSKTAGDRLVDNPCLDRPQRRRADPRFDISTPTLGGSRGFPAPTNIVVQSFDVTVGTALAGLSEEVVFRFYLINLFLLRRRSLPMAVLLSTLIFAAIHWSYGLGITIFAALAGLMFAGLYIVKGNLALPLIAHAGFDAVVFVGGVGALGRIYNQA
jgi:hypothetical protein